MENQESKVYVAVGNDFQDGLATLEWALKHWSSQSISIVILHAATVINRELVSTPFGKLPPSVMSDEVLEVYRKDEQEKIDKQLSKYRALCGKCQVQSEICKIEKFGDPAHKLIVDLISGLKISKLVMAISFMKSSSWRSKSAVSGSFYVHRSKPEFCELFIINGGKLVFLREGNDEVIMEDDQGVMIGRKSCFKGWSKNIFHRNSMDKNVRSPSASSRNENTVDRQSQWEIVAQEIDNYFEYLQSLDKDNNGGDDENDVLRSSAIQSDIQHVDSNMGEAERIEALKVKIAEAHSTVQVRRKEANENAERCTKAEWALSLCNHRLEELEAQINGEIMSITELKKDLDATREFKYELTRDIEENKKRLSSVVQLQYEISNKLQISSTEKLRAEAQLEKAVTARADMVREIEELRRQKDVLQRRIEFCKEKDAIGMASRLGDFTCSYKVFTAEEIRSATDNFSEQMRLRSGGDWTSVYRGRINSCSVAVKLLDPANGLSQDVFRAQAKVLSHIRHPHLVAMIGFCLEPQCLVFEYMHNGSLREILLSSNRSSSRRNWALTWQDRIRIAAEVCSGLAFLHLAEPRSIAHGSLSMSSILLDRNLVAKIYGFRLARCYDDSDMHSDVFAFGSLILQLLTGRNWADLVEDTRAVDSSGLIEILDDTAGDWPLDLAEELSAIAMECLSTSHELNTRMRLGTVMRELTKVRKKADELVANEGREVVIEGGVDMHIEESFETPKVFFCPILREVMKNPHVAADGFSYELEAIEEWLAMGHDTSPMTNLRLKHKHLTANHTLRTLIQDWYNSRSIPPP
ncbi:Serine-threonine/tyrosine-protein kinase, catalytic domain [Dillenia turbinata]|uniref:RING-type E3 ubiquitin transferase n=1 Tax=Dillenia turbinata TaxID=194707 RepID=A0AAN8V6V7_9MAGN